MNPPRGILLSVYVLSNIGTIYAFLPLLSSVPIIIRQLLHWSNDQSVEDFIERAYNLRPLLTDFTDEIYANKTEFEEVYAAMTNVLNDLNRIVMIIHQYNRNHTDGEIHETIDLPALLWNIRFQVNLIHNESRDSLLVRLTRDNEKTVQCNQPQTFQLYLMKFFEYLATVEILKDHIFTNNIQRNNSEDFKGINTQRTSRIIQNYFNSTIQALSKASRDLISCYPYKQSDPNIIELEGFLQSMIVKADQSCSTVNGVVGIKLCHLKKDFLKNNSFFGKFVIERYFQVNYCQPVRRGRPCTGRAINCYEMDPNNKYFRSSKHHWKRWDVITTSKGAAVSGTNRDNMPSALILPNFVVNTRDCLCTCVDNGEGSSSIYMISLIFSESRWNENKIVVGVRYRRKNGIIYVQIKEGTLGANGEITNEKWAEPSGIDESTYSLDENTGFNLNIMTIEDPGQLVVGVGFLVKDNRVSIGVKSLTYDYFSGQLSNPNELSIDENQLLSVPSPMPIIYNSSAGKNLIKFVVSDQIDGGQSTYPFFDGQNIEGKPSFIVTGVGMYHQTVGQSAGTISLKIFSINYPLLIQGLQRKYPNNH